MIPKITLDEVLEFRKARFQSSYDLVAKKGHDYNRAQQTEGDTLFNLKVCEILGVVETAEQGILTRLTDKLMRLISLTGRPGVENAVKDESILNTIDDVHNYVDYLGLIFLKRQEFAHGLENPGPANPKLVLSEVYCIDCKGPLGDHYYGAGDGTGQKFRCVKCQADYEALKTPKKTINTFKP